MYQLLKKVNLPFDGVEDNLENFFVIRANEKIIGSIGVELYDNDGLIRSVAIDPSFQNQGLGHRLLIRIQQYSLEKGLKRLFLLTDTAESFFQRFDFQIISRDNVKSNITQSIEFTQLCPSSALLEKQL